MRLNIDVLAYKHGIKIYDDHKQRHHQPKCKAKLQLQHLQDFASCRSHIAQTYGLRDNRQRPRTNNFVQRERKEEMDRDNCERGRDCWPQLGESKHVNQLEVIINHIFN